MGEIHCHVGDRSRTEHRHEHGAPPVEDRRQHEHQQDRDAGNETDEGRGPAPATEGNDDDSERGRHHDQHHPAVEVCELIHRLGIGRSDREDLELVVVVREIHERLVPGRQGHRFVAREHSEGSFSATLAVVDRQLDRDTLGFGVERTRASHHCVDRSGRGDPGEHNAVAGCKLRHRRRWRELLDKDEALVRTLGDLESNHRADQTLETRTGVLSHGENRCSMKVGRYAEHDPEDDERFDPAGLRNLGLFCRRVCQPLVDRVWIERFVVGRSLIIAPGYRPESGRPYRSATCRPLH